MGPRPLLPVIVWAILVLGAAAVGAAWLNASSGSYRDLSPAVLLVAYSPALLAVLVTAVVDRGRGVRRLLGQFLRWRTAPGWYLLAVLGPFALGLLTTAVLMVVGDPPPRAWIVVPDAVGVLALLGPVIAGSVGEELGWRGFGQARAQLPLGALLAAVAIGLLWSVWHLWIVLTPDGLADTGGPELLQTFVRLVSTSIIYAWLYNASGGSLPVVLVAHAAHNITVDTMPVEAVGSDAGALTLALGYAVAALVVIGATRGRLGARGPSRV